MPLPLDTGHQSRRLDRLADLLGPKPCAGDPVRSHGWVRCVRHLGFPPSPDPIPATQLYFDACGRRRSTSSSCSPVAQAHDLPSPESGWHVVAGCRFAERSLIKRRKHCHLARQCTRQEQTRLPDAANGIVLLGFWMKPLVCHDLRDPQRQRRSRTAACHSAFNQLHVETPERPAADALDATRRAFDAQGSMRGDERYLPSRSRRRRRAAPPFLLPRGMTPQVWDGLHAVVHPADIQDRDGGFLVLSTLFGLCPFSRKPFADADHKGPQFSIDVDGLMPRNPCNPL
jgi:hypothetical protein